MAINGDWWFVVETRKNYLEKFNSFIGRHYSEVG
jgi:hypothetical protein